jgi:hypothetical protein
MHSRKPQRLISVDTVRVPSLDSSLVNQLHARKMRMICMLSELCER